MVICLAACAGSNLFLWSGSVDSVAPLVLNKLLVEPYAKARAYEIAAMEDALKNSNEYSGAKRVFQRVPHTMRRRAASYNIRRIPKRFRAAAAAQMERDGSGERLSKKRRTKRRKNGYKADGWLETHVWHAKRMKMIRLWKFKIGIKTYQKRYRAAIRAARAGSTIHDASYYYMLALSGPEQAIEALLETVVDPTCPKVGSDKYKMSGSYASTIVYHYQSYPCGVIGPIRFRWADSEGSKMLKLVVHPSIIDEVSGEINTALGELQQTQSISVAADRCNRFSLLGPNAGLSIEEVLGVSPDPLAFPGTFLQATTKEGIAFELMRTVTPWPDFTVPDRHSMRGWDVALPAGCGAALWRKFILNKNEPLSFEMLRSLHLETAALFFPHDFPTTKAYDSLMHEIEAELILRHARKPPAKKPSYDKLKVNSPFRAPFESLVSGGSPAIILSPWVIYTLKSIIKTSKKPSLATLLETWSSAILKNRPAIASKFKNLSTETLKSALVPVILYPIKGGVLSPRAEIRVDNHEESPLGKIIGYVTSGGAVITKGRAMAVGAILLSEAIRVCAAAIES